MNLPTKLILIRHGETEWNVQGRIQGHLDSPLSNLGVEQARAVGDVLHNEKFSAVYSSDLGRARQTAAYISSSADLRLDSRLRERNLGIFQGLTYEEAQQQFVDEFLQFRTHAPDHVVPGGESRRELQRRAVSAITELGRIHPGETVVVISHGGVLDVVFRYACALALDAPRKHELNNASLNFLSWSADGLEIERWGDVTHLPQQSLDEA